MNKIAFVVCLGIEISKVFFLSVDLFTCQRVSLLEFDIFVHVGVQEFTWFAYV